MAQQQNSILNVNKLVERRKRHETNYTIFSIVKSRVVARLLHMLAIFVCFGSRVTNACPIVGCAPGNCAARVGTNSLCSGCMNGYYLSLVQTDCIRCTPFCITCSSLERCVFCQNGYFRDSVTMNCAPCSMNCDQCIDGISCSSCSKNFQVSVETKQCVLSVSNEKPSSANTSVLQISKVGPLIGYIVSAVMCALCCTITILHQLKKQKKNAKLRLIASRSSPGPEANFTNAEASEKKIGAMAITLSPLSIHPKTTSSPYQLVQMRELLPKIRINKSHRLLIPSTLRDGSQNSIQVASSDRTARPIGASQHALHKNLCPGSWMKTRPSLASPIMKTTSNLPSGIPKNFLCPSPSQLSLRDIPLTHVRPRPSVMMQGPRDAHSVSGSSRSVVDILEQSPHTMVLAWSESQRGSQPQLSPHYTSPFSKLENHK